MNRRELIQLAIMTGAAAIPLRALAQAGEDWAERKKRTNVRGVDIAYYEGGSGDPIIFLHGNPTSSYLWRNVIPHLEHLGRCIAPDMIGLGDSDPLPNSGPGVYKFATHRDYLFDFLEQVGATERVTLVIHDWGSGVGFSYAQRFPERIKGIAFMEAIIRPSTLPLPPEPQQGAFSLFRSERGEEVVLQNNFFIEQILIGGLGYFLTEADKAEYRRPFLQAGESRRPTLTWPRELPFAGGPADTTALVQSYSDWLAESELPKLFIRANPGALLSDSPNNAPFLEYVRSFPNQTEVQVFGTHYVQEVSPHAIGRAVADWMQGI